MDYFIARWFAVTTMPLEKLFLLHLFERALKDYALKVNKMQACSEGRKTVPPLWWQEGARTLNKEFRLFWLCARRDSSLGICIENYARGVFSQNGINFDGARAFADIDLMHKCDLVLNSSEKACQMSYTLDGINMLPSHFRPRTAIPCPPRAARRRVKKLP